MHVPTVSYPISFFPEIQNFNPAITLEVQPRLVMTNGRPDQFELRHFEEYGIQIADTAPRVAYQAQLKILGRGAHLQTMEEVRNNYPCLRDALNTKDWNGIANGNIPFYDISAKQLKYGNEAAFFPAIIEMGQLLRLVGRLERDYLGKISAGCIVEKVITSRGKAELEARGFFILSMSQKKPQFMHVTISDIYRSFEFYLRLHAEPWFHASMQSYIAKCGGHVGDEPVEHDDATDDEVADDKSTQPRRHNRSDGAASAQRTTSAVSTDDAGDAASSTAREAVTVSTNLGDKLVEAKLTPAPTADA